VQVWSRIATARLLHSIGASAVSPAHMIRVNSTVSSRAPRVYRRSIVHVIAACVWCCLSVVSLPLPCRLVVTRRPGGWSGGAPRSLLRCERGPWQRRREVCGVLPSHMASAVVPASRWWSEVDDATDLKFGPVAGRGVEWP
jgi:hypothetical protein